MIIMASNFDCLKYSQNEKKKKETRTQVNGRLSMVWSACFRISIPFLILAIVRDVNQKDPEK